MPVYFSEGSDSIRQQGFFYSVTQKCAFRGSDFYLSIHETINVVTGLNNRITGIHYIGKFALHSTELCKSLLLFTNTFKKKLIVFYKICTAENEYYYYKVLLCTHKHGKCVQNTKPVQHCTGFIVYSCYAPVGI